MRTWCETRPVHLEWLGFAGNLKRYPRRVRCPKCKRRFLPFTRECQDSNCYHLYLPPHET